MEFAVEPFKGGADVVLLAEAMVELTLAEADAAEVEAEGGKAEAGEGLGGVVDDLVVHGAAEEGMRVADEGGEGGFGLAGVEQGFEGSGGSVEIGDGADLGAEDGHVWPV